MSASAAAGPCTLARATARLRVTTGRCRAHVQCRDGRLHLIGSGLHMPHGLVDQGESFVDHGAVPEAPVLILHEDDLPVAIQPRRGARMLQQQQRRQSHDFGFTLEEPQQQPGKTDGFVAQRESHARRVARRRVPLVENQVNHGGDGRETPGAFHGAGCLERQIGPGHARFCPRDPLLHGAFAHQKCACDLLDVEPGNDAQRERDLLSRRQLGMTADEQQPQQIVAVIGAVEPIDQLRFDIVDSASSTGRGSSFRWRRAASSAAFLPTRISHAAGSRGGPFWVQFFRARRQAS